MEAKKFELELHLPGDGRAFLNHWNPFGKDVCAKIMEGKLFVADYDENGDPLPIREVSLAEFLERVATQ